MYIVIRAPPQFLGTPFYLEGNVQDAGQEYINPIHPRGRTWEIL